MSIKIRTQSEPITTWGNKVEGILLRRIDASSIPTFVAVTVEFYV